jgi:transmembrane sensor
MNYQQYSVEDFVLDETFRKWVLDSDKASHNFWSQWLDEHPRKVETVRQAIELLRQIPVQQDKLSEQQISSITQAIEEGIDRWEETGREPAKQEKVIPISAYAMTRQKPDTSLPKKPGSRVSLVKIAACIMFVLSMLYVVYHEGLYEKQEPGIVYKQVVKETPEGQKLTVFLADGSQIILNAGSRISFTKPFHPDRRIIALEGEAFFKVAKDSLRPFQVISGELITTALGTSFNIAAYPKDDRLQVSLISGKVKVDYQQVAEKQESEAYYLVPGEQVAYDKTQHILAKEPFDADKVLAWKEGVIYLENAEQATVIKTLERWYGIHIEIEGKSATAWSVTAKFNNQSLNSVLTSLSYTMGFVFEIREDRVIIKYS